MNKSLRLGHAVRYLYSDLPPEALTPYTRVDSLSTYSTGLLSGIRIQGHQQVTQHCAKVRLLSCLTFTFSERDIFTAVLGFT
jgi:hypothetical protein